MLFTKLDMVNTILRLFQIKQYVHCVKKNLLMSKICYSRSVNSRSMVKDKTERWLKKKEKQDRMVGLDIKMRVPMIK